MDHGVEDIVAPICGGLIPPAIKPDAANLPIVCAQLFHLADVVLFVSVPVARVGPARFATGTAERIVICAVPIQLRVVEKEFDALFVALSSQLLHDIALKGRRLYDVVICEFAVEHTEAIVMLAGDGNVFDPRIFRHLNPRMGIKFCGIELRRQLFVLADGDAFVVHNPFAMANQRIDSPVNKHAKARIAEPLYRGGVCLPGLGNIDWWLGVNRSK